MEEYLRFLGLQGLAMSSNSKCQSRPGDTRTTVGEKLSSGPSGWTSNAIS
jgi:hypothetical protein